MDFKETHYSVRHKIGDAWSISTQNINPLHSVVSKPPESPYGAKYIFLADKSVVLVSNLVFCRPLPRPPWKILGKSKNKKMPICQKKMVKNEHRFFFHKYFRKYMLVRYRGKNNKGVLERPGTKWKVLRAISSTLKCQFTGKC